MTQENRKEGRASGAGRGHSQSRCRHADRSVRGRSSPWVAGLSLRAEVRPRQTQGHCGLLTAISCTQAETGRGGSRAEGEAGQARAERAGEDAGKSPRQCGRGNQGGGAPGQERFF